MKRISALLLLLLLPALQYKARATSDADTLDVVNWNLDWFASGSPLDAATQMSHVRAIMQSLNADVYALCEVVNVDSFSSLTAGLGNGAYAGVVSTFASLAASPASGQYANAQKLGFIYRKSVVKNVSVRAMLGNSGTAYTSFSSGRYPYQVDADVLGRDGLWRRITFIIIHAKAQADATSCNRRTEGCKELKDSLDLYHSTDRFLLLGDYNDDLDHTICSGGGASNYLYMVQDSAHYKSITLPLERSGAISIDGYSSLIDNVIASDEMYRYYVPGSALSLRSFVKGMYPNYDNQVSDHFPVRTRYVLDAAMTTSVAENIPATGKISIFPNPARDKVSIRIPGNGFHSYELVNAAGITVLAGHSNEHFFVLDVGILPPGLYCFLLRNDNGNTASQRLTILR